MKKIKNIFFLAIIIRFFCLYLFRNVTNYDLQSYIQVGQLTSEGVNIYPEFASLHHPYFPFFLYIEAFAIQMSHIGLIRFIGPIYILKTILIFFDLGILYLVYLLSNNNLKKALIYAINPVTVLATTLHGQFDVMPIFLILLSVYLLNKKNITYSVICYSIAIVTKTWPVIFLIPFTRKFKKRIWLYILILIPIFFILFYCLLFKTNPINIGKTLISYQGLWGLWGLWSLLGKTRILWQKLITIFFLIGYLGYSYFNIEKNLVKNIYKLLFFFFVFTPNFSIQYLAWIIPFLILIKPKFYLFLIILITIYLFSFYYFWLFCQECNITPNWLTICQNISGFLLWLSFIKLGYLSINKWLC
jgi:hypothetical protein